MTTPTFLIWSSFAKSRPDNLVLAYTENDYWKATPVIAGLNSHLRGTCSWYPALPVPTKTTIGLWGAE